MSRVNQHVTLSDRRKLGYNEYGPADGKPLFYFHGTPSSRIEWQMFGGEQLATLLHLRVISIDRPGMGLSDFQAGRRLLDWPTDVVALAQELGIDHFSVLAFSGGGPYAAVCALAIPERLTSVGIVSGAGTFTETEVADGINPMSRQFFDLCRDKPVRGRMMLRMMGAMAHYAPNRLIAQSMAALPEPDQMVLKRPEVQQWYLQTMREAQRRGPRGAQHDTALMVSPWEFHPQEIKMAVHLWYGEADRDIPIAMGRSLAAAIPKSQAHFYPDEGHLSVFVNYIPNIMEVFSAETSISV
jgi:pimeloyl-ACP methyl ester carboxylesterase